MRQPEVQNYSLVIGNRRLHTRGTLGGISGSLRPPSIMKMLRHCGCESATADRGGASKHTQALLIVSGSAQLSPFLKQALFETFQVNVCATAGESVSNGSFVLPSLELVGIYLQYAVLIAMRGSCSTHRY